MVVVHVKGEAEENQFLYECPSSSGIEEMSEAVVETCNLQSKIQHLSIRLRERFFSNSSQESWTGPAGDLYRAISEAETYASKDQVLHKRCLSPHVLRDHLQNVEKEVMVSHLMGSSESCLSQLFSDFELLHEGTTQLWWAGKEFVRGKRLCDYIGSNEKTKITVRLQSASPSPTHHSENDSRNPKPT